jgi:hypothetical protein
VGTVRARARGTGGLRMARHLRSYGGPRGNARRSHQWAAPTTAQARLDFYDHFASKESFALEVIDRYSAKFGTIAARHLGNAASTALAKEARWRYPLRARSARCL